MKIIPKTIASKKQFILILLSLLLFFCACHKLSSDKFISYKQYVQLRPGKFFIYQLDSIVPSAFGASFVVHSYIIKDSVIDTIYDNLNRPSLRVFRYVKDTISNQWESFGNTFIIIPTTNTLEYIENNLRYVKLSNPVSAYTYWKGNDYVNLLPFSFDSSFLEWDYSYNDIGAAKTFSGITYANTITVVQYDSTQNTPFNIYGYNTFTKSYEVYADSVGLVYKDLMDQEYQVLTTLVNCKHVKPNTNGGFDTTAIDCNNNDCDSIANAGNGNQIIGCDTLIENGYYNGYGIRQVLLSHN